MFEYIFALSLMNWGSSFYMNSWLLLIKLRYFVPEELVFDGSLV